MAVLSIGRYRAVTTALGLSLLPALASAASYYQWEAVTLDASTGASCGNGSPYRFFVNRALATSRTIVIYEGGSSCFTQSSCLNNVKGALGASLPNGIPLDYMTNITSAINAQGLSLAGLITPFATRVDVMGLVQTQSWNIVYVPYCTGDLGLGNKVAVYNDQTPGSPTTYYHRGYPNMKATAQWLGKNLPNQTQVLAVGVSSAAGTVIGTYDALRSAMKPTKSAVLADSGPLFPAPRNGSVATYPSIPLQNKARDAWGYDAPNGVVTELVAKYPAYIDPNNLGSWNTGLAKIYPKDRFSHTLFLNDGLIPAQFYSLVPQVQATPAGPSYEALTRQLYLQDIKQWVASLSTVPNIGYYIPYERTIFNSHTLTAFTFSATQIPDKNYLSVTQVVDDLIGGTGTPIRAQSTKQIAYGITGLPILDALVNQLINQLSTSF